MQSDFPKQARMRESEPAPKRIQRKRTNGWRMPTGAVYVGRPSKWGNPWRVHGACTAAQATENFRGLMAAREGLDARFAVVTPDDIRRELRGKDLACWCPLSQSCHADVLLELANGPLITPREPSQRTIEASCTDEDLEGISLS